MSLGITPSDPLFCFSLFFRYNHKNTFLKQGKLMILRPLLISLSMCGLLMSAPYEKMNANSLMSGEGNAVYVNIPEIFYRIDKIYERSRSIPMNFDNEEDQKLAHADIVRLQNLLITLDNQNYLESQSSNNRSAYLLRKARLYVSKNNFGAGDVYNKADLFYNIAVSENISDSKIHLEYANYLASLGEMDHAKSEFQWALDQGERKSLLGLAIIYSLEGYVNQAIEYLKQFEKEYSSTNFTTALLAEISKEGNGNIDNKIFLDPQYLNNF